MIKSNDNYFTFTVFKKKNELNEKWNHPILSLSLHVFLKLNIFPYPLLSCKVLFHSIYSPLPPPPPFPTTTNTNNQTIPSTLKQKITLSSFFSHSHSLPPNHKNGSWEPPFSHILHPPAHNHHAFDLHCRKNLPMEGCFTCRACRGRRGCLRQAPRRLRSSSGKSFQGLRQHSAGSPTGGVPPGVGAGHRAADQGVVQGRCPLQGGGEGTRALHAGAGDGTWRRGGGHGRVQREGQWGGDKGGQHGGPFGWLLSLRWCRRGTTLDRCSSRHARAWTCTSLLDRLPLLDSRRNSLQCRHQWPNLPLWSSNLHRSWTRCHHWYHTFFSPHYTHSLYT